MSNTLQGKVAIVTGGSRGIGAGIAQDLARRGAHVLITYNSSSTKADEIIASISSSSQTAAVQADCASPTTSVPKVIAAALKFTGSIDIIVNNAGDGTDATLEQVTAEIFHRQMDVNLLFPLLLVQAASPHLNRGGRIVNISSTAARRPAPYAYPYGASKAGLESITKSLAVELGDREITVNAVNPGPVSTDMWTNTVGVEEMTAAASAASPLKRIAEVEDIVPIVGFLCEPAAKWITGSVTCANGGLVMV